MGSVCAVAHPTHLAHQTQWALLCVYTTNIRRKEESCFFSSDWTTQTTTEKNFDPIGAKKKIWRPSRETLFLFRHHRTHNSFVWLLWSVISYLLQLFIVLFRWDDEENAQKSVKNPHREWKLAGNTQNLKNKKCWQSHTQKAIYWCTLFYNIVHNIVLSQVLSLSLFSLA